MRLKPSKRRVKSMSVSAGIALVLVLSTAHPAHAEPSGPEQPVGSYPAGDFPTSIEPAEITWWTFAANAQSQIDAFNEVYPDIQVEAPLVGGDYTKLTTVIKGGSGGPDVARVEYQYLPKYVAMDGLLDIAPYVNRYEDLYYPWTWSQVSRGDAVYGVPEDIGPATMSFMPGELEKHGIEVPTTWDEFADAARAYKKAEPDKWLTFAPINDAAWWTMLYWQAGAVLFDETEDGWKINFESPAVREVTAYWADLIDEGVIEATENWTPTWQSNVGKGKYAALIAASWAPNYMIYPFTTDENRDAWRMTTLPQWDAAAPIGANQGGATNVVLKQSKHPEAAALFAAWISGSEQGATTMITNTDDGGQGLSAAAKNVPALPAFYEPQVALNGQVIAEVMDEAAATVDPSFQWSPWSDYVFNEMNIEFNDASQGKQSWDQALADVQKSTEVFAASMGYTVATSDAEEAGESIAASDAPSAALWVALTLALLTAGALIYRRQTVAAV